MDADVELLRGAPAADLLFVAVGALVRAGADRATGQLTRSDGRTLDLVAHLGFDAPFLDALAVVGDTGPTARCRREATVVEVVDVATDPDLAGTEEGAALLAAGTRACTSFPVCGPEGTVVGVLTAHHASPGHHPSAPGGEIVRRVEVLLRDVSAASAAAEVVHLRRAVETRGVIGTAKGLLMASSGLTEDQAFRMLVAASQRENRKLRDVCARIVDEHEARVAVERGVGSTD